MGEGRHTFDPRRQVQALAEEEHNPLERQEGQAYHEEGLAYQTRVHCLALMAAEALLWGPSAAQKGAAGTEVGPWAPLALEPRPRY